MSLSFEDLVDFMWSYTAWQNNSKHINSVSTLHMGLPRWLSGKKKIHLPMQEMPVWSLGWEDSLTSFQWNSIAQSCLTLLRPHGLQHAWLTCPSPTPGACSNSCPLSWWCHPAISFSVTPFSSSLQSFLASGSFPVSRLFKSGGQTIWASAPASFLSCIFRTQLF